VPLLNYADVRDLLPKYDLQDAQLNAAMRLVGGWLQAATGVTALPDPILPGDPLYAPAVELVKLEVVNPEQVRQTGYGPKTRTWPAEPRRNEILAELREQYRRVASAPTGSFPLPPQWPDPTRRSQVS
jgi:hypothetical protein